MDAKEKLIQTRKEKAEREAKEKAVQAAKEKAAQEKEGKIECVTGKVQILFEKSTNGV